MRMDGDDDDDGDEDDGDDDDDADDDEDGDDHADADDDDWSWWSGPLALAFAGLSRGHPRGTCLARSRARCAPLFGSVRLCLR